MTAALLATDKYLDDIRLRRLWPPYSNAMSAELLAILPRWALEREGSPWLDLLAAEDWYLDGGGPCLVLGRAIMRPDGNYYPEEFYSLEKIVQKTREYRQPQQQEEKKRQEAANRAQDQQKLKTVREEQWRQAAEHERKEAQRRAAQRNQDPRHDIEDLKKRLAQLEGKTPSALTNSPVSDGP